MRRGLEKLEQFIHVMGGRGRLLDLVTAYGPPMYRKQPLPDIHGETLSRMLSQGIAMSRE